MEKIINQEDKKDLKSFYKELFMALGMVLFIQILYWVSQVFLFEYVDNLKSTSDLKIIVSYILYFGIVPIDLFLYYAKVGKIIKKKNYGRISFRACLHVLWFSFALVEFQIVMSMVGKIIAKCTSICFLNGIEYFLGLLLLIAIQILILLIDIVIAIYKHFKRTKKGS